VDSAGHGGTKRESLTNAASVDADADADADDADHDAM